MPNINLIFPIFSTRWQLVSYPLLRVAGGWRMTERRTGRWTLADIVYYSLPTKTKVKLKSKVTTKAKIMIEGECMDTCVYSCIRQATNNQPSEDQLCVSYPCRSFAVMTSLLTTNERTKDDNVWFDRKNTAQRKETRSSSSSATPHGTSQREWAPTLGKDMKMLFHIISN